MFALLLLWESHPAFGGGRFFVGIGAAPLFTPRAIGFFHHRRAGTRFFFQFGHQPFVTSPWAPDPWRSYYPPAIGSYPVSPQEIPQQGSSGTDPSGTLYVDGYRVLPSGWLRVHIEPTDAEVLIDGFAVSVNSASGLSGSLGFPVGKHHVEVRKAGFKEFHSEVEIVQGQGVSAGN